MSNIFETIKNINKIATLPEVPKFVDPFDHIREVLKPIEKIKKSLPSNSIVEQINLFNKLNPFRDIYTK
jgi:hypothetical protein